MHSQAQKNLSNLKKPSVILVNNLYIGKYNDEEIGLFSKTDFKIDKKKEMGFLHYDAGEIYTDINGHIGIRITHDDDVYTNFWAPLDYQVNYNNKTYCANCAITEIRNFNQMRIIMYNKGLIPNFNSNIVTREEFNEVLNFSLEFYKPKSKQKKK